MSGFDSVLVKYDEDEKEIAAVDILDALAQVEEAISFYDLSMMIKGKDLRKIRMVALSKGYAVLLKCAGFTLGEADVARSIARGDNAANAINGLVGLFNQLMDTTEDKKKIAKPKKKKSTKRKS